MRNSHAAGGAGPRAWTLINLVIGFTLYPLGDLIAQLIIGEVSAARLLALSLMGGLVYRLEVTAWFRLLDTATFSPASAKHNLARLLLRADGAAFRLNWLGRTAGAWLYFNPLWIARHVFVIAIATTAWSQVQLTTMLAAAVAVGAKSFVANLPLSLAGNYLIQERLPLRWRFLGSVVMSAVMAIAYALELAYFG